MTRSGAQGADPAQEPEGSRMPVMPARGEEDRKFQYDKEIKILVIESKK